MVHDYDLFYISGSSSSSSTTISLYLNGSSANGSVIVPDDYVMKANKMTISNSTSSTQYVTLVAAPSQYLPSGTPSIPIATISVPATGTIILSDEDLQSIIPSGYYLQATIPTAVSGISISATAYFSKG